MPCMMYYYKLQHVNEAENWSRAGRKSDEWSGAGFRKKTSGVKQERSSEQAESEAHGPQVCCCLLFSLKSALLLPSYSD